MAIAEQFAGLNMDQLIGGPLRASADASAHLANSTADFINRVGFDRNGKVRTVAFAYQKRSVNEDGTSNLDEMKVDVPMLAIVPIPNLQIDEVNILFDMEVKQSERQESSFDLSASTSAQMNFGIVKVNVSGSVSAHQSNTRSSDNSAKYHVDVRATNHGMPEGLARVLDMMAANVAPALVGSTIKDSNGQDLSEKAKQKAERLKALRQEISQIENRLDAARKGLENNISQLSKVAGMQLNVYQSEIKTLLQPLDPKKEADQKTADDYHNALEQINDSWNGFKNNITELVRMLATTDDGKSKDVSQTFSLNSLKSGKVDNSYKEGNYYAAMVQAQNAAVNSQKNTTAIEDELFKKKAEYSDTASGVSTSTPALTEPKSTESKTK